ncbi:hypothetical protein JB92DRAFT_270694 [Gautieria morchelliformis]|nr:hypothetical protein JB92DRAFT_270694 [Gautieria morchelliformis]
MGIRTVEAVSVLGWAIAVVAVVSAGCAGWGSCDCCDDPDNLARSRAWWTRVPGDYDTPLAQCTFSRSLGCMGVPGSHDPLAPAPIASPLPHAKDRPTALPHSINSVAEPLRESSSFSLPVTDSCYHAKGSTVLPHANSPTLTLAKLVSAKAAKLQVHPRALWHPVGIGYFPLHHSHRSIHGLIHRCS